MDLKGLARKGLRAVNAVLNRAGVGIQATPTGPRLRRAFLPRTDQGAVQLLSPRLREDRPWPYEAVPVHLDRALSTDVAKLWLDSPGGHKWLHYFSVYEKLFTAYRGRGIKVLEIGIYRGASLNLWSRYFGPGATIVGVDINPDCARFEDAAAGIHVRIGSQADPSFLDAVVREFGPFDVIIDDGSHIASHMVASFNILFETALKPTGLYMIEDVHCAYWGGVGGYLDQPRSVVHMAQAIVDAIHVPYRRHPHSHFAINGIEGRSVTAPRIAAMVDEVRFFDSIIAIQKAERLPPVDYHR